MLSNGMKEIKSKKFHTVLLVSGIILLFYLAMILFVEYRDREYLDFDDYFEKILILSKRTKTIDMQKWFEFEFDKVYVVKESEEDYADKEFFLKKLGVASNLSISSLECESKGRMLFIKDEQIVRDFIYERQKLCFSETGIVVYPRTIINIIQDELNGEENAIKIVFGNIVEENIN